MAWQVMIREPAQAGNRAGRTEHYLQWWENSPEWNAESSAADKQHDSGLGFVYGDDVGALAVMLLPPLLV